MDRNEADLQAYHDGELRGLARWRFERRLARSPELQGELRLLLRTGEWLRQEGAGEAPDPPDLWPDIARRLEAGDPGPTQGWLDGWLEGRTPAAVLGALVKPVGAVAAAAAAAVFMLQPTLAPEPPAGDRVVRWIDSGGRNVLVDDRAGESVTVIWLLDAPVEGASRGGHRETA